MSKLKMGRNPRNSVGTKLFLIVFLSIVVLISALGISSYQLSKQIITDEVAEAQQQTINLAADKMDAMLETYTGLSRQLLVDKEMQAQFKQLSMPNLDRGEKSTRETSLRDELESMRASHPAIAALRLIPKTLDMGRIVSTSGASSPEINDSVKAELNKVIEADGETVYLPSMSKGLFGYAAKPMFTMGRLLKNMNQRDSEYIIIMEFPVQILSDTFSKLKFGEQGAITIVTDSNQVVYSSSDKIQIGEQAAPYTAEQLVVRQQSVITGWTIEGSVWLKDILSRTDSILLLTVVMCGIAAIVAILIGYLLVRMVARPLEQICGLMEQAENGNLTVRAKRKGRDEIARLSSSFDRMLTQISALVIRTNASTLLLKERAEELIHVSNEMSKSSEHINNATGQIAGGAMQLADEAEKGLVSVDTIKRTMEEVAATNNGLNHSSDRFQQTSSEAAVQMTELVILTNDTEQKSRALVDRINQLKKSTASIRQLLDVMNAIARQTNILSLNAAIEAARSGTAGKGFMVVAGEIRQLAEQSKQSIVMVNEMTATIEQEMEATAAELHAVVPILQDQSAAVNTAARTFGHMESEMKQVINEIAYSSKSIEELAHMQQTLVLTIGNVSAVSEQSAASTMEVTALTANQLSISGKLVEVSNELDALSADLHEQLTMFQTA